MKMPITNFASKFLNSEDGAVTVDFVVLTATIVFLGLIVGLTIRDGATSVSTGIEAEMISIDVRDTATMVAK